MQSHPNLQASDVHVLILAGGCGTRLWPLSTEERPKQFLSLCGNDLSLLQLSVRRMLTIAEKNNVHVVSGCKWKPLVDEQLDIFDFARSTVIEEPEGRNTAPAIALGVARLLHDGARENDIITVCPSDHLVKDEGAFREAIEVAIQAAREGNIVTLGIIPTKPETGFGYIKTQMASRGKWLGVESFVEKPNRETAIQYLESGEYYWNGGIFCFRIVDILEAFHSFSVSCHKIITAERQLLMDAFLLAEKISFDYEVMEKARNIVCVPLSAGWSDVGSWEAIYENAPKDEYGNVLVGDVTLKNGKNNLIIVDDTDSVIIEDLESVVIVKKDGSLIVRGSYE